MARQTETGRHRDSHTGRSAGRHTRVITRGDTTREVLQGLSKQRRYSPLDLSSRRNENSHTLNGTG